MDNKKIKISELGKFESTFNALISKYKLESKANEIFDIFIEAILGKLNHVDLADRFMSDLNLDFATAGNLAYDLKKQILDKKGVETIEKEMLDNTWQSYMPEAIADELLRSLNYQIKNENLKKRFVEALVSWLQDLRDIPELKDILIRSEKIGGVGMPESVFERLYDLLLAKKEQIKNEKVDMKKIFAQYNAKQNKEFSKMPESLSEEEIDVAAKAPKPALAKEKITGTDTTIDQLLKEKGVPFEELKKHAQIERELAGDAPLGQEADNLATKIAEEEKFLESKEEIAPPVPEATVEKESKPLSSPSPFVQAQTPAMPKTEPEPKQPIFRQTISQTRPRMDDVKFETKLYGPIEELGAFKIDDFRRLAKDPVEAAGKISAKLDLLEDESLAKRAEGINALKSSPLYKDYSDIMNQAISSGKSIEQVLSENQKMNFSEFKAIMNLNKSLKY